MVKSAFLEFIQHVVNGAVDAVSERIIADPGLAAQADTILYLLSVGADPNARDKDGVAPLHRAIRTRSLPAVKSLLDGGADPIIRNKSGSTPLHLAVQTTGRSGSGSEHALEQQAGIIKLLLERGASPTDQDARGKEVFEAATNDRVRELLVN